MAGLPNVEAWEHFARWATARGWRVSRTPRRRTRCDKNGSVVFGPGHGGDYRELAARIEQVDVYMTRWCRP
jgi:hypothetical protein